MENLETKNNEGKQMLLFKCAICGADCDRYFFAKDRDGKMVLDHWCLKCRPHGEAEKDSQNCQT